MTDTTREALALLSQAREALDALAAFNEASGFPADFARQVIASIDALATTEQAPAVQAGARHERDVWIDYTNWRGERGIRHIRPQELLWLSTEYHREPQWLLHAWDVEKRAKRDFALKDIHSISTTPLASTRGQAEDAPEPMPLWLADLLACVHSVVIRADAPEQTQFWSKVASLKRAYDLYKPRIDAARASDARKGEAS
jgi:predicted DNA-binding transcriptional regulator YafY